MRASGRALWSALMLCGAGVAAGTEPVVPTVREAVQPAIERHLGEALAATRRELGLVRRIPALGKLPLCVQVAEDPWAGMAALEAGGLKVAGHARTGLPGLPAVLDALASLGGKKTGETEPVPRGPLASLADHAEHIQAVLDLARKRRDAALAPLPKNAAAFLTAWTPRLLRHWGPQLPVNERTRPILHNDRAFCVLAARLRWGQMLAAANALASLSDPAFLQSLRKAAADARPIPQAIDGVTGPVLLARDTPHGLVLIAGTGRNTFALDRPVACLIDLGGDDLHTGRIAASVGAEHPLSVVIDLDGDDVYDGKPLGLATGLLGVGLLVDLAGKDTYRLAEGSGGVGLAGIGVLCDAEGDDGYAGSKFTQGAAFAGLGLLLDLAGRDEYTSHGSALGFGGPGGVAAAVDVAGDDRYQCGHKFPSAYNRTDAPEAQPGDPEFQYTAMGLGVGQGRRILSQKPADHAFALAGGLGLLLDLAGHDRTDGSNFALGCGYFFGIGLTLDLAGDDTHGAARYGHGAAAHCGIGLFVDYQGADTLASTGPTYNAGCAWDHSAALCVNAGAEGDIYRLERSSGLGRADIGAWAVFADLAGEDRYAAGSPPGRASRDALAVFLDRAGADDYSAIRHGDAPRPADGAAREQAPGGLFLDR